MKKRLLSFFAAAAVVAGSLCGFSAAEEQPGKLTLSPRASIEIVDGEVRGITGPITADWLRSQFEGDVKIIDHRSLEDIAGETPVASLTAVFTSDESDSVNITIPGDVYIDGKIALNDVTSLLKGIAGWTLGCCEYDADSADLNRDGKVNLSDVTILLQYIAKWNVQIFDSAPVLTVFEGGETEYKLLANDAATDEKIVSAIKALTGKDIEVVTEVSEGDKFITVGKNLQDKYDFIDGEAVAALEDTKAYIDTYGGNIYVTAATDNGILGCINYITNQAFTPELDMYIEKGTVGELGDMETLIRPTFTTIEVPGLTESHRLLHVTDSHLTTVYEDEETPERRANVMSRLNDWMVHQYRKPSYLYFNEYFNYGGDISAEAIMLTGDITDSPSQSNRDILEKAIDNSPVPAYYMYGNHDWTWNDNAATGDVYHSETFRHAYRNGFAQSADKYDADWNEYYNVMDMGEYTILSIDNAWQGFPGRRDIFNGIKAAFDQAKAENKPIILLLHVPIHNDEMHEAIPHITGNGYCLTAGNCGNSMIYDMIVAEDSPVAAILAGHVHANYECTVGNGIPQIVTGAALEGYCRVIDLVPAAE